jgi:hypothetical protein
MSRFEHSKIKGECIRENLANTGIVLSLAGAQLSLNERFTRARIEFTALSIEEFRSERFTGVTTAALGTRTAAVNRFPFPASEENGGNLGVYR